MTFLTINQGKIEIHADISAIGASADFVTGNAYEAARWLFDHGIYEWMNSSSMDFATDDGWHRDDACQEVTDELNKLRA